MNISRKLISQLSTVKSHFALSIVFAFLNSLTIVVQAFILARIINDVFLNHADLTAVRYWLIGFAMVSVARMLFQIFENNSASSIARTIKYRLRKKLISRISNLSPEVQNREKTGELVGTINQGIDSLESYFSEYLPQLVLSVLIPVLILIFVFPIDLLSGFVFLLTAPLIPLFMVLIGEAAQAVTKKQWTALSRMSAFFLDVIQGIVTLKILGKSRDYVKKIEQVSDEFRHTTMKVLRVAFLSALTLEMLATISTAIIAVEIGLRLLYCKMDFLNALFILILAPEFYQPLRQLGARFHSGMEGFTASKRIFEIMDLPQEPIVHSGEEIPDLRETTIRIENVGFQYPGTAQPVFSNVSFSIHPKQKIALVGPSGSGKTTLSKLLLKLLPLQTGEIKVGDLNFKNINPQQWQKQVSWISQHPYLFHDTIKQNLLIAKRDASDEEIKAAVEKAFLNDVLEELPDGLETVVGERGARFSGGQAQRIALARAFLKNSPIIMLDEPTSNLDPQTEEHIIESVNNLTKDKTVLLIAHRLNTIKNADLILRFGEKVESCEYKDVIKEFAPV